MWATSFALMGTVLCALFGHLFFIVFVLMSMVGMTLVYYVWMGIQMLMDLFYTMATPQVEQTREEIVPPGYYKTAFGLVAHDAYKKKMGRK